MTLTASSGFQERPHTADWALDVWAPDLIGLLQQAARKLNLRQLEFPDVVHERLWGVKYLVAQGIADSRRVGILGGQVQLMFDAITTMGISPVEFLVLPRMLALILMRMGKPGSLKVSVVTSKAAKSRERLLNTGLSFLEMEDTVGPSWGM